MQISVKADITEAMDTLEGYDKNRKTIKKNLLKMSGRKAKSKVKKAYGSYLHKNSGTLYKSVRTYTYRNGSKQVVTAHNKEDKYRYGFALAHGYDVEPKNAKTLTFQIDGKWYHSNHVHVDARDWVEEPGQRYLNSNEYRQDLDTQLQKEIDKIDRREAKKAGLTN